MDTSKAKARSALWGLVAAVTLCALLAIGFAPPLAYAAEDGGGGGFAAASLQVQDDHGDVLAGPWEIGNPTAADVKATLYEDGTFVVTGAGMTQWFFSSSSLPWAASKDAIKHVEFAEGIAPQIMSMDYWFYGCTALESVDTAIPNGVASMSNAFNGCSSLKNVPQIPADVWDLTNAFADCVSLTAIPSGFSLPASANATTLKVSSPYDNQENRLLTVCDPDDYESLLEAYDWTGSNRLLWYSDDAVVAWKSVLAESIANANELLASYQVSDDGAGIEWPMSYIDSQTRDAFSASIAAAAQTHDSAQSSEEDVKDSIRALRDATVRVKASEQFMQPPADKRLANLEIGVRRYDSNTGITAIVPYEWDGEFDASAAKNTVFVPMDVSSIDVKATLPDGSAGVITMEYSDIADPTIVHSTQLPNGTIWGVSSGLLANRSVTPNFALVKLDDQVVYRIDFKRKLVPSSLSAVSSGSEVALRPAFNPSIGEYEATVPRDGAVDVELGLYGTDTLVKVNSSEVAVVPDESANPNLPRSNAKASFAPAWASDRTSTCTVELSDGLGTSNIYTITLKEAPASISIAKMPDKVSYTAGEPIDLTGLEVAAVYAGGPEQVLAWADVTTAPAAGDAASADMKAIVVTVGALSAEIPITVDNPHVPDNIQLFGDLQLWSAGKMQLRQIQYDYSPKFDSACSRYSVAVGDTSSGGGKLNFRFGDWYSVEPEKGVITLEYIDPTTGEMAEYIPTPNGGENTITVFNANDTGSTAGNTVYIKVNGETAYVIDVHRKSQLSTFAFQRSDESGATWTNQALTPAFTGVDQRYEYSMYLQKGERLRVATAPYANNASVRLAGRTVPCGQSDYNEVPIQWSDDRTYDLEVDVVKAGTVTGAYTVHIMEPPASLRVVTQPSKLEYVDGEAFDLAGLEVEAEYPDGAVRAIDPAEVTLDPEVASIASASVRLVFRGASAEVPVTVRSAFEGEGTEESPFRIATAADYDTLRRVVASGTSMQGKFLEQAADITLPDGWTPIGVTKDGSMNLDKGENLNAFCGTLDGGGFTVTVPVDCPPLFGYVKGATVKNLNVYGERIAGYGLINNMEGVGLSGTAVVIDNVTLKSGSSTLKSGLLGGNLTTNPFAATSGGYASTIQNCTVEQGVTVGYTGAESEVGGITGRFQGTVENCVSYADVKGYGYVGGIVGKQDQAMGSCIVKNSAFHGTVTATSEHAGGIVGGGYDNETAPNGGRVTVEDCVVDGTVTGADKVGGIVGGDSFVDQSWGDITFLKGNKFTGTVAATASGAEAVGGIVGFINGLNKCDQIVGNYFAAGCGAERGIGKVRHVDTTKRDYGVDEATGVFYYNTNDPDVDFEAIHLIVDGADDPYKSVVKTGFARDDDPLGADAELLCHSDEQLADYSAVDEALAKVPDYADLCTDESAAALKAAIDAVDRTLPAWADGADVQIAAWARAIEDAVAALEVDEGKALDAAQAKLDEAEELSKAAAGLAGEAEALKNAADAANEADAKAEAAAKAAEAAAKAADAATEAKAAAEAADAAARFAVANAKSDGVKAQAEELAGKAQQALESAKAAEAAALKASREAAKAAEETAAAAKAAKAAKSSKASKSSKAPKANPMKVTVKKVKVKAKKLKKKAKSVKAVSVTGAQGKVTYRIVKVKAKKKLLKQAKKRIKMAAGGKLKLKKKLKKGTYKVTVRVAASGNASYRPATKDVVVKVKVK